MIFDLMVMKRMGGDVKELGMVYLGILIGTYWPFSRKMKLLRFIF